MKTKKHMKKRVRLTLTAVLLVIAGVSLYHFGSYYFKRNDEIKKKEAIKEVIQSNVLTEAGFSFSKDAWNSLYEANNDFVGYLAFPDEYVSEPILKAKDNGYYLYRSFDKTWSDFGSVYMDYECENSDTNITIYGHHIIGPGFEELKFGPISELVEQDLYDQHHEFSIWWEDHQSKYVITNIYYYNVDENREFDYKQRAFADEADFNKFKDFIDENNVISAVDELRYGDRFVTLQTCRDLWSSIKIIAVCKEVEINDSY